ncbi:MAG TPA: zinc transporter ZupT [Clostridia bacterium]|jgi:ZIP family zinc transporter|nr:zinc transporter ZupT [Clostridiaceae bacterium]HHT92558.1 zinc transporter ZupT [Clostridiaceae bacterium]HOA31533.1 zinc transporter ZupT [Clostridia bacterium]HPZ52441.1 zinc transporter ZupT [Clostridia bacterium]
MDLGFSNTIIAFGITLLAGLATGIGSLLAFYTKRTNEKFLAATLGFSAGVMIYVSLVEIFAEAKSSLIEELGAKKGYWVCVISFFAGIALIALIDKLVPQKENPHEMRDVNEMDKKVDNDSLLRMGLFSALAIAIHNFPEGIATFMSAIQDPKLGISIAVAVAIHNIPEGIAVSIPVYYATGNRKKAFMYSFLSGLSEPLGAIVGFILLRRFISPSLFGIIFASVAGIMVYISLDELMPTAEKYGHHHISIYGLIAGMAVMALSLLMFA